MSYFMMLKTPIKTISLNMYALIQLFTVTVGEKATLNKINSM